MKKISKRLEGLNSKIFNKYFTSRHTLGLIIFTSGFLLLTSSIRYFTTFEKLLILLLGVVGLGLALFTIYEYFVKVYSLLQEDGFAGRREFIFAISTFVGFVIPIFFVNNIFLGMINIINNFGGYGTLMCEIRCNLVKYYYQTNVFDSIAALNSLIIVLLVLIFFFGVAKKR